MRFSVLNSSPAFTGDGFAIGGMFADRGRRKTFAAGAGEKPSNLRACCVEGESL